MRSASTLNGHAGRNGRAECKPAALAVSPPQEEPHHSIDFRSVSCHLGKFIFSPAQAAVVRVLWEAWSNDTPDVGQETLLDAMGSEGTRLSNLFYGHPAWGTMIVSKAKGSYRLQAPAEGQDGSGLAAGEAS